MLLRFEPVQHDNDDGRLIQHDNYDRQLVQHNNDDGRLVQHDNKNNARRADELFVKRTRAARRPSSRPAGASRHFSRQASSAAARVVVLIDEQLVDSSFDDHLVVLIIDEQLAALIRDNQLVALRPDKKLVARLLYKQSVPKEPEASLAPPLCRLPRRRTRARRKRLIATSSPDVEEEDNGSY